MGHSYNESTVCSYRPQLQREYECAVMGHSYNESTVCSYGPQLQREYECAVMGHSYESTRVHLWAIDMCSCEVFI